MDYRNLNSFSFLENVDDTTLNSYAKTMITLIQNDIHDFINPELNEDELNDLTVSVANEILRILD